MKVIIFGAGIAGLTVAHELLSCYGNKLDIEIYEQNSVAGGFAQSSRDSTGMPTEHSWRGYAPFYDNLFDIIKRIPFQTESTNSKSVHSVHQNILFDRSIRFLMPHDNKLLPNESIQEISDRFPTYRDVMIAAFYTAKGVFSDDRLTEISQVNYKKLMKSKDVSIYGVDRFIKMLGPGLGLNENNASLSDLSKYLELKLSSYFCGNRNAFGDWYVLNGPTNVKWIDPWVSYLKSKRVKFHFNTCLKRLHIDNDKVTSATIHPAVGKIKNNRMNNKKVTADIYVSCLGPYSLADVLRISNNKNIAKNPQLNKTIMQAKAPPHNQIAFSLLFKNKINMVNSKINEVNFANYAITFPDSEFNITVCPQDNFFKDDPFFTTGDGKGKTMWSGTVCVSDVPGRIYNKPAINLTKSQLCEEIKAQMFNSAELNILLKDQSTEVDRIKIWKHWHFDSKKNRLVSHPKWVTTTTTYGNRPSQITSIKNLFLGGAHTNTTTKLWSMEGAVESGKLVVMAITKQKINEKNQQNLQTPVSKVTYFSHDINDVIPFGAIRKADNVLFNYGLPNITYFILLIIIILLITLISKLPLPHLLFSKKEEYVT